MRHHNKKAPVTVTIETIVDVSTCDRCGREEANEVTRKARDDHHSRFPTLNIRETPRGWREFYGGGLTDALGNSPMGRLDLCTDCVGAVEAAWQRFVREAGLEHRVRAPEAEKR